MIKRICVSLLFSLSLLSTTPLSAQAGNLPAPAGSEELGNWMMYFGLNRISNNWSIHSEVQWRNHEVTPNLEQLLLRAGMNYHINNNFMATGGYGYISTHPYADEAEDPISTEHRIWQQFIIRNSLSRVFFEHRYRVEQRWVNKNFSHRFRYRLLANVALNKPTIGKGTFFLSFYDEIFAVPEYGRVFDRNRLYGAVGYQISASTNVQVGLMRQSLSTFSKDYLQFAVFFNPDFR